MKISGMAYEVRKRIPEILKKPLRFIWHKWNMKIDLEMQKNLAEYYHLKEKEVMRILKIAGRLNADYWKCVNPKTESQIIKFYEDTPFYVLNLTFWHSTRYQRKLRRRFVELAAGRVLDYGGGAGDLCLILANQGLEVNYADVEGRTYDFAKWLFAKNNHKIAMINLSQEKISQKYDTIFCIDVIEHVTNPKEVLKDFFDHLNPNGKLIITALHPEVSESIPMHFELKFNPEEYIKSLGMSPGDEEFLWVKK